MNLAFCSLIRIFDFVENTFARQKKRIFSLFCALLFVSLWQGIKETSYNMDIKRITCRSSIEAAALKAWLEEANINCVIYDETNSKVARGILDQTMDVMVRDEDWERANAIYEELLRANNSNQETEA